MVPARPRVLARMATPRRYTDPDFLRRVAPQIYGGTARHDPETPARLLHTHSRAGSPRGYAFQLLAAASWTSIGFLPRLRQPTLVLTGDDDPLIPTVNGHLLTALIPRARLHVYPGGHLELIARPNASPHGSRSSSTTHPPAAHRPQGGHSVTDDLQVGIGDALSTDYFFLRDQLTETQRDYLARARRFVDDEVLPTINDYWDRAEFPWPLVEKLGTTGLLGDGIAGYGCPPMDPLSAGLITMELNRGDGSIGTFVGVQAGLAMRPIGH
jgi:hypothetical protein